jgi:CBS domain-containing protein
MVSEKKLVKDIMCPIEEYEFIGMETPLCDALALLKKNHKKAQADPKRAFHKTMLVKDDSGKIVGKLSAFDLTQGLVPEPAKKHTISRSFYSVLSSRALEVADQVHDMQQRFKWLHSTFGELIQQESRKKVKDVMSPVHPLLVEDDSINKAICVMFSEETRQPLVTRDGKIVGVVRLLEIFDELLEILGDECLLDTNNNL